MCGVIGLIYDRYRDDLGRIAAELLKSLEYRGYDSTGAAIQGDDEDVRVLKGVGAPSVMADQLGITPLGGRVLCGQVRWATFGAVDATNAQPHHVGCKTSIYGAHNGNVTNCDDLKAWLISEGHAVCSDNDGEMVVHTVEHYFARELEQAGWPREAAPRRAAMRAALTTAATRLRGSYAAVIVDPVSRCLWTIKQGSSLYFGLATGPAGDRCTISSSDLSAVLKLTRVLVPVSEGEFVEHDAESYQVYRLKDGTIEGPTGRREVRAGEALERQPVRSRLHAKDAALVPPFETFMDQEISAQEQTCRDVITLFLGGTEAVQVLGPYIGQCTAEQVEAIEQGLEQLRRQYDDDQLRECFYELVALPAFRQLLARVPEDAKTRGARGPDERIVERLTSSEAGLLADLVPMARDLDDRIAVRLLDAMLAKREVEAFAAAVDRFTLMVAEALRESGRVFVVCCGSSYHAAKAAGLFFNEIARAELIPVLPGEFRGQYSRSLVDGDLFIAVSQSGETKDLIDVIDDAMASGRRVGRVALVNNVNSTLAQEKSDLVIPLRCGAEVAVPATKSFMNQMVVFYCLALRMAQRMIDGNAIDETEREGLVEELRSRVEKLPRLPALLRETFDSTETEVERAAQLLFLCPSIQILATRITAVAKEGALKVREVVLNHTEGFEGSEFKHGPNTILGFNTLFGPLQVDRLLKRVGQVVERVVTRGAGRRLSAAAVARLAQAVTDSVFSPTTALLSLEGSERALLEQTLDRSELHAELYADYPLIYITGPERRDVDLTVSQINTHKIRGAMTVVIAEEDSALRQAASKAPANNPTYESVYVTLPRTNDSLMTVFSATVVLQRLALKMSLLKKSYLDRVGIKNHGVHPDVPKNVSKSITVD